ncbi:MAG: preprotein translocase subunit SecG [Deltaproteobacteria bacterium]|nr:preprotein translocase subunit SecG [Deltaproteobacteria bacterium]MBW2048438.1 preprotein translocase subunit SecG [Deltaproteobacteria bacterium]MBW2110408.1 preprotein translocase subunit SecG [Deltaproteobacteria bacterium]MBW2351981.1 preprotein translocase subunit SecG [Deltaproteobacteria bacterium]HDZ89706.1 preprotein translocase subunit SecG [Deltaproteobacteria bacterium]
MTPIIIILHVCVCVALILIVLLQKGKGAGMGAAFGGSSQTVFGSAGATTFLHKVTTIVAVVFMLTSLGLSLLFGRGSTSSIMEDVTPSQAPAAQTTAAPAQSGETQEKK